MFKHMFITTLAFLVLSSSLCAEGGGESSIIEQLGINSPVLNDLDTKIKQAEKEGDIIALLSIAVHLDYLEVISDKKSPVSAEKLLDTASKLIQQRGITTYDSLPVRAMINAYLKTGRTIKAKKLLEASTNQSKEESFGFLGSDGPKKVISRRGSIEQWKDDDYTIIFSATLPTFLRAEWLGEYILDPDIALRDPWSTTGHSFVIWEKNGEPEAAYGVYPTDFQDTHEYPTYEEMKLGIAPGVIMDEMEAIKQASYHLAVKVNRDMYEQTIDIKREWENSFDYYQDLISTVSRNPERTKKQEAIFTYKLIERDCVSFIDDIAREVDLIRPPRHPDEMSLIWFPFVYLERLMAYND